MEFKPDHLITMERIEYPVMLVEGVCYTKAEWDLAENADFTYDEDKGCLFQGQAFNGTIRELKAEEQSEYQDGEIRNLT